MKNLLFGFLFLLVAAGCKESDSPTANTIITVTDAQLYQLAKTTSKAAFFNNSTDTVPGNSGAAHAGKIIVWYNAKAKEQLDTLGRVKTLATFSDSSLIVKEIFNDNGVRQFYAIMLKLSAASNKGAGNWVWAELKGNGDVFISASENGQKCGACHTPGIDYTRTNDSHP
ncbi:MAG: hypothetical protein M0R68_09280 [Bacteroidetes bacterium]|nr:hypothetical protein [Bacteroidota bacterium]